SVNSLTPTTTSVTSSPNPSFQGQSVTFTANVATLTGSSVNSGSVIFSEGQTALSGSVNVVNGQATFATSSLSIGSHIVTAAFTTPGGFPTSSGSTTKVVQPAVTISDVAIAEGNSGTSSAVFIVSLSGPTTSPVSVDFATADGTATTAGNDYVAKTGTVSFN